MILADTDVLIDYLAGVQPLTGRMQAAVAQDHLATTAVNCFAASGYAVWRHLFRCFRSTGNRLPEPPPCGSNWSGPGKPSEWVTASLRASP